VPKKEEKYMITFRHLNRPVYYLGMTGNQLVGIFLIGYVGWNVWNFMVIPYVLLVVWFVNQQSKYIKLKQYDYLGSMWVGFQSRKTMKDNQRVLSKI